MLTLTNQSLITLKYVIKDLGDVFLEMGLYFYKESLPILSLVQG